MEPEEAVTEGKAAIGAAGEEGEAGALVDVLSEVLGEAAAGVEEEAAGASRVGGDEGEAVDGDATGGDVTGLDGTAGSSNTSVVEGEAVAGLEGTAGEAVKAAGLAAVDTTGVGDMSGGGDSIATGTEVPDGKGGDSDGGGGGMCTAVSAAAAVAAGVTGEAVGCDREGENRGVEAYGEATCKLQLDVDNMEVAAYSHI